MMPAADSSSRSRTHRVCFCATLALPLLVGAFLFCAPLGAHAAFYLPPFPYRAKECTLVYDGGVFHMFYIRHRYFVLDDSTERDFGHAVTSDFQNWTELDPVLPIRPSSWDNFHVWSPQVVRRANDFAMFYTGVTHGDPDYALYQRLGLATSTDLMEWVREPDPILGCDQVPWVLCDSTSAMGGDFRDPFVMPDPTTPGSWLMYNATRPAANPDQMVLELARSDGDFKVWTDLKPMWNTGYFNPKIESPAVIEHDGLWYLFYTTNSGHAIKFETSLDPTADSTGWSGQINLRGEITNEDTDQWFGPEIFQVAGHDYFCAPEGDFGTIQIREILWTDPPHFQFAEPDLAAVVPLRGGPGGVQLRFVSGVPGARRWRLEVITPRPTHVRIDMIDPGGRRIRALSDRDLPAGPTRVEWDGRDDAGRDVPAGVYFAVLRTKGAMRSVRFPVLR
jgi:hypothetical protein